MTLVLLTEGTRSLLRIEDTELLTKEEFSRLTQERDDTELFDLIRTNNDLRWN